VLKELTEFVAVADRAQLQAGFKGTKGAFHQQQLFVAQGDIFGGEGVVRGAQQVFAVPQFFPEAVQGPGSSQWAAGDKFKGDSNLKKIRPGRYLRPGIKYNRSFLWEQVVYS
jgi:hypothetical protein